MNASDLSLTRTYSAAYPKPDERLNAYADLFSRAVRSTFALFERDTKSGTSHTQTELKKGLDHQFDLTSRQAYSVLTEAQARRDSLLELMGLELDELQDRLRKQRGKLARGQKKLAEHKRGKTLKLSKLKRQSIKEDVFHAQTKVTKLKAALVRLKARTAKGITSMVFGTKKAMRQKAALLLEQQQAFDDADFPQAR